MYDNDYTPDMTVRRRQTTKVETLNLGAMGTIVGANDDSETNDR